MVIRVSYQSEEEEKLIFEWIDKVIEFFPEFEKDIFSSIMHSLNCNENNSIVQGVGSTMLRLNIFEKVENYGVQYSNFGREVKKHGNYSKYKEYSNLKKEKEKFKHTKEMENLEFSIKMNKWLLKTKWLPHILSALALILSILSFFF